MRRAHIQSTSPKGTNIRIAPYISANIAIIGLIPATGLDGQIADATLEGVPHTNWYAILTDSGLNGYVHKDYVTVTYLDESKELPDVEQFLDTCLSLRNRPEVFAEVIRILRHLADVLDNAPRS